MPAVMRATLAKLDAAIRDASRDVNWLPALKVIRLDVIAETRMNFDRGQTPDGAAWAALKYPRWNSKGGDRPLRNFDILMASVTAPGATGNVDLTTDRFTEWGSNLDYAGIHQLGGVITPKTAKMLAIPATAEAYYAGSPRNFGEGRLDFRWGKGGRGGVAVEKRPGMAEVVHFYFARKVTIPKREFLGITEEMADDYADIAAEHAAAETAKRLGGDGSG